MTFRLVMQPMMAAFLAFRAGWRDARAGRMPYGLFLFSEPSRRRELLREGWKDVARLFVFAMLLDLIYQVIALRWFYPGEAAIVAALLALIPYLFLRGPATRMMRLWHHGRPEVVVSGTGDI